MRNRTRNFTFSREPTPNRHSRDLLHASSSNDMDAVDFLHHENPPIWAGPNLGVKASAKPTTPPSQQFEN
ncbi:hypothetical protein TNCV_1609661 [Trichonephila clavipes]|nr:hypothetical protein TNCV_1609661 [Trichonephila clavipes]